MFPKARFVHVVRDPYVIFPSTVHTWKKMYQFEAVQSPRYAGLEQYVLDTFVRMYEAFDDDVRQLPAQQLCEVRYEDLIGDMVGQVGRIYDELNLQRFEQVVPALEAYIAKTADYKANRYQISPEIRRQIGTRWRGYIEKYGYSSAPALLS